MKRLPLIFLLAITAGAWGTQPNILFIMLDDVGAYSCAPYGCDTNLTQSIDSIATDGMIFGNMHANQYCAPSRGALMTGREQTRTGIRMPNDEASFLADDEITIAKQLQGAGYTTGLFGKWNLWDDGSTDMTQSEHQAYHGIDESLTFEGATISYWVDDEAPQVNTNFWPYLYMEESLQFLEENTAVPFALFHMFGLPHYPLDEETPLDTSVSATDTDNFWKKMEYADFVVSNLLAKVESLGIADNTIIILTGDNGTDSDVDSSYNGTVVAGGKGTTDMTGTWVPFYVRWPDVITAGSEYNGISQFSDIPCTLADLAGAQMPADRIIDGKSFYNQLTGASAANHRRIAYIGGNGPPAASEINHRTFNLGYQYRNYDDTLYYVGNKPYGDTAITSPTGLQGLTLIELKYTSDDMREKVWGNNPWGGHEDETILLTDSTNYIPIEVISLAVSGASTVAHETTNQYEAVAIYADLAFSNVTAVAVWTDEDNTNTTINAGELIVGTMTDTQTVNIAASFGGITNALAVELQGVTLPPPVNLNFVTTWENSDALALTIPTTGTGYNFDAVWTKADGTLVVSNHFEDADFPFINILSNGTVEGDILTCTVSGTFPRISFNNAGDKAFLRTVENIGSVGWSSFEYAFYGCEGLTSVNEGDADVSGVLRWGGAFRTTPNLSSITLTEIGTPTRLQKMFTASGVTAVVVTGWELSDLDSSLYSLAEMFSYSTLNTTGAGGADELIIYFGAEHSAGRLPLDDAVFDLGYSKLSSNDVDAVAAFTVLTNATWTINFGGWE